MEHPQITDTTPVDEGLLVAVALPGGAHIDVLIQNNGKASSRFPRVWADENLSMQKILDRLDSLYTECIEGKST